MLSSVSRMREPVALSLGCVKISSFGLSDLLLCVQVCCCVCVARRLAAVSELVIEVQGFCYSVSVAVAVALTRTACPDEQIL